MKLNELHAANDLLDDPQALPARYERDGCLLVRGALDPTALATITDQASSALVRCGIAQRLDGLRWTGAAVPYPDDTGLGLAVGSHHQGRLPRGPLPGFTDRPGPGGLSPSRPATGIDPQLVNDHWHTASMQPGDLITFSPDVVHRGLPATSDRIRLALTVIVSATSDPRPHIIYTGRESRARFKRVAEFVAELGISECDHFSIAADLTLACVEINEETVRAAARGDYSRK